MIETARTGIKSRRSAKAPRGPLPVEQPNVELIVRLTARFSAAVFAAALILFVAGYQHDQRRLRIATRLFAAFIVTHTIHFGTVAWLAAVTGGENIRQRDGWTVVLTVALLFYVAALVVLRAWRDTALRRSSSRSLRVAANVGVLAIAAVFLNSYLARVERMPLYWLPAIGLFGLVALYFVGRGFPFTSPTLVSVPLYRRAVAVSQVDDLARGAFTYAPLAVDQLACALDIDGEIAILASVSLPRPSSSLPKTSAFVAWRISIVVHPAIRIGRRPAVQVGGPCT